MSACSNKKVNVDKFQMQLSMRWILRLSIDVADDDLSAP